MSKVYLPLQAGTGGGLKGKIFSYRLTSSAGFRVYKNDLEVRVKAWGSNSAYQIVRPFGEHSTNMEARI